MRKQVALSKSYEPLQIPIPRGFKGERTDPSATEFYITTTYTVLSIDEIAVVQEFLKKLPYQQSLSFGALLIDPNDPLLKSSHEDLDQIEARSGMVSSRNAPRGGNRSIVERVLQIRELGYVGNGHKALAGS